MYENCVVPLPGRARKPRPRTHGIMLDKMSKSLGGARMRISVAEGNTRPQTRGIMLDKMSKSLGGVRMRISVAEGNRRPHDPVQAAKFASEAGVVVRKEVPILMH